MGWTRTRAATCSKPSSPKTQTSQSKKWSRADRKSSASAVQGWIFLEKKCWRSWMIRMIRFLTWLKRLKLLDQRQTSALQPRSLTLVKLLAICRFLRTLTNIGSNYLRKSTRATTNASTFQRTSRYLNSKQMLRGWMQMAIQGVRRGLQRLLTLPKIFLPTWKRSKKKRGMRPTTHREIIRAR